MTPIELILWVLATTLALTLSLICAVIVVALTRAAIDIAIHGLPRKGHRKP